MEQDEKWNSGKKYLDMTEYFEWHKENYQKSKRKSSFDKLNFYHLILTRGNFTQKIGLDLYFLLSACTYLGVISVEVQYKKPYEITEPYVKDWINEVKDKEGDFF
ncbi:hypothetical protein SAMN05660826_02340 [Caldanaerovirga acetigignens]|uniref:Uncharacterized protein n=1 Tax=Caldanaerovirga acetigignens TaxID=447595 RepID=A0A1M7MMT5_9FIRM|nr:hypothetical protein SAMN05660826_02340 [Caldanaerovirga acetigignens]